MAGMGALKPWHLLVLLFVLVLPALLGWALRDRLTRTQWLLTLLVGVVLLGFGVVAHAPLLNSLGFFVALASTVGAITTRQRASAS